MASLGKKLRQNSANLAIFVAILAKNGFSRTLKANWRFYVATLAKKLRKNPPAWKCFVATLAKNLPIWRFWLLSVAILAKN